MGLIINVFLFIGTFILLIVAAGFATDGARRIESENDSDLESAHKWLTWTAVISWISVALIILGGILYAYWGLGNIVKTGNWVIYIMLFLSMVLVILIGIFSAIAASKMNNTEADNKGAYHQAIVAAVLGIVGFILILTLLLITFFYKPKNKFISMLSAAAEGGQKDLIDFFIKKGANNWNDEMKNATVDDKNLVDFFIKKVAGFETHQDLFDFLQKNIDNKPEFKIPGFENPKDLFNFFREKKGNKLVTGSENPQDLFELK